MIESLINVIHQWLDDRILYAMLCCIVVKIAFCLEFQDMTNARFIVIDVSKY